MNASFLEIAEEQISTSPGCLMKAFEYVIETAGRRQVTDLHVRRLLNYVRAHDRNYTGVKVSLAQLASILFLSVPTCRRVIRRAVKEFNLLIVIPQRHHPGGQTVNRYTINWDNVDATLYDIELAQCAAESDTNTTASASNCPPCSDLKSGNLKSEACPSPVRLAPDDMPPKVTPVFRTEGPANCLAQAKAAKRDAGLGINAEENLGGLKARPFATANDSSPQSSTHPESTASSITNSSSRSPRDIEKLIFENRLLSCHPRVLRIPERLIPKDWPYTVRRYPKETPLELIAHLNVLLFKLQTAMDRAQKLKSKKIFYRLRTLYFKLNAVHRRACHGAMCRTNLPPTKPFSNYSRASTPLDLPSDPSDVPNEQQLYELALANLSEHARSASLKSPVRLAPDALVGSSLTPNGLTLEANPVDLSDQASSESSYSLNAYSLQPESLAPAENNTIRDLLLALDDLLADVNSALKSARDHRSYWLQNRFTILRRSLKTLRKRTTAFTYTSNIRPCDSHPQKIPTSLAP